MNMDVIFQLYNSTAETEFLIKNTELEELTGILHKWIIWNI